VVYRGKDPQLPRDLAIKVLRPDRQQPDLVRRFIEEAKITSKLQHPGVVPVHSLGQMPDGRPYFTMKLIRGQNLAALLAERASPSQDLPRFLKIFEQVCQTLAYTHSQGIVHRDLKPANIMVGASCRNPKLRDPVKAVELAKQAVAAAPRNGTYWQTLAWAQYRAADWKAAIASMEKVKELGSPGDSIEWFLLAMAHQRLGKKDEARKWYEAAVKWMERNNPNDEQLRRCRAEAAELLGIKQTKD